MVNFYTGTALGDVFDAPAGPLPLMPWKMKGLKGNDLLIGDILNDTIDGGDGNDILDGVDGNDRLLGGKGNDSLFGGSGDDYLDGGAGNDVMVGGSGDDTYIVNHSGDVVAEAVLEGYDIIRSSVSYTLPNNVEALVLTGTAAINGTGNGLNNEITGNNAINTILAGGGDDDVFAAAGNDTVYGEDGIDDLNGGNGHDSLLGGNANDNLVGNDGDDTLVGDLGADVLRGGLGADHFHFNSPLDKVDKILDFSGAFFSISQGPAQFDKISISSSGFGGSPSLGDFSIVGDNFKYLGTTIATLQSFHAFSVATDIVFV